jgi:hypothetical protein
VGEALHGAYDVANRVRRDFPVFIDSLAEPEGSFLCVNQMLRMVFVDVDYDQAGRVGTQVNDANALHKTPPRNSFWLNHNIKSAAKNRAAKKTQETAGLFSCTAALWQGFSLCCRNKNKYH